jgi:hypothetical protein
LDGVDDAFEIVADAAGQGDEGVDFGACCRVTPAVEVLGGVGGVTQAAPT